MMSQQTIFVDREDKNSGSKAADMIVRAPNKHALKEKWPPRRVLSLSLLTLLCLLQNAIARDDRWPHIVVYPEGNTCNGRQICGFKARRLRCFECRASVTPLRHAQLGPFQPGVPVQPMVISYARNKRMDPCWVEPAGLPVHIVALRLLLQFHNYMEARAVATACANGLLGLCSRLAPPPQVKYLPVMHPSETEKKDPALFAARAQRAMAEALNVPVTEHSFADTRLLFAARKLKVPLASAVLEMDKVARLWGASYADCRDVMERFAAAGGACGAMRCALRAFAACNSQPDRHLCSSSQAPARRRWARRSC